MNRPIVAIYDKLTGYSQNINVAYSDDAAIRDFATLINNPGSLYHDHPGDYSLHSLGLYDYDTGIIEPVTPRELVNGLQVLKGADTNGR